MTLEHEEAAAPDRETAADYLDRRASERNQLDRVDSIPDSAIEFWRAGIPPVKLRKSGKTKRPVSNDWPLVTFEDEAAVRRSFAHGHNLGIRLGGGLADVDLDSPEAIGLADMLLPATGAEFGKASTPRSHRLYWIRGGGDLKYAKHVGASRESLVELRADGGKQTQAPSSTHESGEPVRWAGGGRLADAAEVDGDVLTASVAALALAALLRQYWPGEGSRNNAFLALVGALLRGAQDDAVLIEMVERIVTALATATDDEEAADRAAQTVPGTCRALADGRGVTGWTTLRELLVADDSPKVIEAARTIAARLRDALGVPPEWDDGLDRFTDLDQERARGASDGKRRLVVQRASEIKLRRVLWLWEGRMALGALSLLAGREGLGKSSLVMWLVAMITLGTLPGNLYGQPRAVIIAATEDSWEHTLVPRLIAAGADLNLVLRVDVMTSRGFTVDLSLPDDIPAVKELAEQEQVALMVLDPIMSRLHGLDTHKDSEVRIALEPLVRMADETNMSLIGLIHLNKSSTDPLNAVMGSKAFTAVARSVSTVVPDDSDEDDRRRLFGTVKNNLGPALPASQVYTIETAHVDTEDGPMPVGKLVWHGQVDTTIKAAMADAGMDTRTAVEEAQLWLGDFLSDGATFSRKEVIAAAGKVGISESSIKRAAAKIGVVSAASGFPRVTFWSLPELFEADAPGEES